MNNYQNIPNLSGKVAIVSGANSGTGYGITYHLAKHGCKVIMAARNSEKLTKAVDTLRKELPGADLEQEILSITSMASVREFCNRIQSKYHKIDFLVNNAGAGNHSYVLTEDGYDENLTVNYLGHFALTTQLLPVLKDGSRIVNFSSIGYKKFLKHQLDIDNLMCQDAESYNQMQEYCKAKLCSILHAVKLQREFEARGINSKVFSCHPGNARTSLMYSEDVKLPLRLAFKYIIAPLMAATGFSQSLYDGALPAIEALVADDAVPHVVYSPSSKYENVGPPIAREIDRTHFEEQDIDKLWDKTQEILGLSVSDYL
ncbi:MAG: SDR family NAD(P)-dependent oxidoreductase [Cellvibrionaceae bacterium]|nr:SDR family NAD(P)-dependent oxidoreductase [Cellvibrionaceae bacterium]